MPNRPRSDSEIPYRPQRDTNPYEDGGVMGSLQRILYGDGSGSESESGGFTFPADLPIDPETDYQIVSSFYRGQLRQATTGREQAAAAEKLGALAIQFTAAQTGAQAQAAVARATPQKEPVVYQQPRPRELPERSGEKAAPQLTDEQEQMVERVTDQIRSSVQERVQQTFAPPHI